MDERHERRGPERGQLIPPEYESGIKLLHWLSPTPKTDQKFKIHATDRGDAVTVVKIETIEKSQTNEHGSKELREKRIITPAQLEEAQRCIDHLLPVLYHYPMLEMAVTRAMPNVGEIRRELEKGKAKQSSPKPTV